MSHEESKVNGAINSKESKVELVIKTSQENKAPELDDFTGGNSNKHSRKSNTNSSQTPKRSEEERRAHTQTHSMRPEVSLYLKLKILEEKETTDQSPCEY